MRFVRVIAGAVLVLGLAAASRADGPGAGIASRDAAVDGLSLHYATAGKGPAVILLHGYAETSRMWWPLIPVLAGRFMVIAPDLPGIGGSAIPKDGLDVKTAAARIHALVRSLGVPKARVVGHDIGLMVAYAYAAMYPSETEKLVLMDAFVPGVEGWEAIYDDPHFWHFRFHGPTPEALVAGRERTYFDYFWNDFAADKNHSIPEADRAAYTAAYSRPGRMRAAWGYFTTFPTVAPELAALAKTKLTMPLLTIGGAKSLGEALGKQGRLLASDVTVVVVPDAGHWILEENSRATTEALVKFL
ncbi:MAG TPA: alpha/beta hydrolase [Thermoanaerobaculia bacterium]|nr:alpha/beta hydrolase [Thermoanaerobaculia bacterium]